MSSDGVSMLQGLVSQVLDFAQDAHATLADPARRAALANDLGGRFNGPPPAPRDTSAMQRYRDAANPDWVDAIGALNELREVFGSLHAVFEGFTSDDPATGADEAFALALELLAQDYVRRHRPKLYFAMQFVAFLSETSSQLGEGGVFIERFFASLIALLHYLLFGTNLPGKHLQTEADAQGWSFPMRWVALGLLITRIAGTFDKFLNDRALKLDFVHGFDTVPGLPQGPDADVAERMLSLRLSRALLDDAPLTDANDAVTATMALVPDDHGGPGFFLALGGQSEFSLPLGERWQAHLRVRASPALAFLAGGDKHFQFSGPATPGSEVGVVFDLTTRPTGNRQPLYSFPSGGPNRLDIGRIGFSLALNNTGLEWRATLHDAVLSLSGEAFDGFVGSLWSGRSRQILFSVGTGFSSKSGFFTTGNLPVVSDQGQAPAGEADAAAPLPRAGSVAADLLRFALPLGADIGPVRLHELQFGVGRGDGGPGGASEMRLGVSVSLSAQVGPVMARVDRLGLSLGLSMPADRSQANLHFVHLAPGYLPPTGVGLAIDAKAVRGGGFVQHDAERGVYAGVVELELYRMVSVKAVALVATRLPDGGRGYSMLFIITAEGFRPIPLGMGFSLAGIGGLLAIHRTANVEALREGLAQRSLDAVLFPRDPVRNAGTLLATLERVFPSQRGSYFFGPILRITWGTPAIITADLALIIEWGVRDRLLLLGRLQAALPDAENDLLRLRMDVLGVLDFDQGSAAIDALLIDSRLLRRFPLTGAMALRARWKSPRSFVLAVGGLHRGYTPPAGFPALQRLAVSLTTGSNPRLTCEAYFALTANTVQFGAAAHLVAEAAGFRVLGDVGFDVLITLAPFHFLAEFMASMQIARGSRNLLKVKVQGALEGPLPLALRAKATFEILWWDVSIRVNATLVGGARPPLPAAVNALAQLMAALRDARNWSAELPPGQSRIVVLAAADAGTEPGPLRVHPLAVLAVRQSVAPLDTPQPISRFGNAPVAGARQFRVAALSINGKAEPAASLQRLHDDFAPAQFFEMNDGERLASPSFLPMAAGVQLGDAAPAFNLAQGMRSPLSYETKLIDRSIAPDKTGHVKKLTAYALPVAQLESQVLAGAAARSALRRDDPVAAEARPAPLVKLAPRGAVPA